MQEAASTSSLLATVNALNLLRCIAPNHDVPACAEAQDMNTLDSTRQKTKGYNM